MTGKEYKTISYDRLSCGFTNVIYGIHCVHCGLVYVGETGRSLRSRMIGHRSAIKKVGQSLLHRHFHQPDHSVNDMRVQELALESTNFDYSSAEYRVTTIILDIASYRLSRPVRSGVPAEKPKNFMIIKFLNKAVDAINLPALL